MSNENVAYIGDGLCLSGETEYLGEDLKWKRIDQYKGGKVAQWNNGLLEFVKPLKYIHNKNSEFLEFRNKTKLSMKLTPNHDVLIRTSKGNLIKHKASHIANKLESDVCNMGHIIHDFKYINASSKSKYADENQYRLQVAFCADGSLLGTSKTSKRSGRIRVLKQNKKEMLREILEGTNYLETNDKEYSIFYIKAPILSKSLYECFYDEDWDILKEELFKWDGDQERKLFRTTSKEDADFAQLVLSSYGKVATITKDDRVGEIQKANGKEYIRKSILYTVSELASTTTALRETKGTRIEVIRHDELEDSYCFSIPSSNLVVRHNDRVFITGN